MCSSAWANWGELAFQAEHKAVVEVAGIVTAIAVE
jgi:hypothetical protein